MKTIMLFFAVTFTLVISAKITFAQNWLLSGNSNASAASKLGTTNSAPLAFYTNNKERARIDSSGKMGIGTPNPLGLLTVRLSGGTPASSWLSGSSTLPAFIAFSENMTTGFNLATAGNTAGYRPVLNTRRSRGSLASPAAVKTDDMLASYVSSGYDGGAFQNPATIDFYVDSTPYKGNVPARISFVTGTNSSNRKERLKVDRNGNFDFNNGQAYLQQSTGFFGIGTVSPDARVHAVGSGTALYGNSTSGSYGVYGKSSYLGVFGDGGTYGVYGYSNAAYGVYGYSGTGYAIYGSSTSSYNDNGSTGVYGSGYYGMHGVGTYGVWGESKNYLGVYGLGVSYGVYGSASSGSGYGLYGVSNYIGVYASGTTYGVYSVSSNGVGVRASSDNNLGASFYSTNYYGLRAGTGLASQNWAGVFDGSVYTFGTYQTSDRNLKKNIKELAGAMDIIERLKPKKYEFIREGRLSALLLPAGSHYGLIVQELQEVLPELVKEVDNDLNSSKIPVDTAVLISKNSTPVNRVPQKISKDSLTIKAVNYTELIPIMIKAMQEQNDKIKTQQDQINQLAALVQTLSKQQVQSQAFSPTAFLKQNIPNPSRNGTVITYHVPENTGQAQIKITDIKGRLIKAFSVKGDGQITLKGNELSSGVYNYTLYINNIIADSKQMVISR